MTAPDNGQAEVKLADFDLDQWIDGTTGITGIAKIIQKGDLLAKRDRLVHELELARKIPAEQRGVGDRGPEEIQDEIDGVYQEVWESCLFVHVQDRTEARRKKINDRLKKQGVGVSDTWLHLVADAIVKVETADGRIIELGEDGFPPAKLRAIGDRCGDAALLDLNRVFTEVISKAPAVSAPLSHSSSSMRGGRM